MVKLKLDCVTRMSPTELKVEAKFQVVIREEETVEFTIESQVFKDPANDNKGFKSVFIFQQISSSSREAFTSFFKIMHSVLGDS